MKHQSVKSLCRALNASRSAFYRWLKSPISDRKERDIHLKRKILLTYTESHKIYGYLRIHKSLYYDGEKCGKKRVARLMKELSICSKIKRKYKVTTNSNHNKPVAKNLIERDFQPGSPNDVWASDITYIRTREGWLYLAVVMDLFSRKIVGWSVSNRIDANLVEEALLKAIKERRPKAGLLFHSDRGAQYASEKIQNILLNNDIACSMSRKGDCYDNAVVESFFNSLKSEWTYHKTYETRIKAKQSLFEYIEIFYNRSRLHSTLGYLSPVSFESCSIN